MRQTHPPPGSLRGAWIDIALGEAVLDLALGKGRRQSVSECLPPLVERGPHHRSDVSDSCTGSAWGVSETTALATVGAG